MRYRFDLTLSGKYLKDLNNGGYQDITVVITSYVDDNDTDTTDHYLVFNGYKVTYQIGTPLSGDSGTETIQSSFINIDDIYSILYGGHLHRIRPTGLSIM